MKKYIYKITNNINGKIYIGQSKNVSQRWKQHCIASASKKDKTYFHLALAKYGVHNFSIEIIEGPIENYNEREKYWIKYYDTYNNREKGYNMAPGGEEPVVLRGEKSCLSTYSDELISLIIQDLKENILSYEEISKKYQIHLDYLYGLNQGRIRKNDNFSYPIRKNGNERKSSEFVELIIYDLLYTTKSIEEIAREKQVGSNIIYYINKGKHVHCPTYLLYPIRNPYKKISNYLLDKIYEDLLDDKLMFSEIEKKYNLSKTTINRINNGKIYKQNNFSYPLRPSSKRVYHQNL